MSVPQHSTPLRCWAEIDLAALERNLKLIRASLPPAMRYVAVVKADAYGHGLHHVAARLMHAGADLFAVANVAEAAALREIGPGWPILLLSPLLPEEDRFLAELDLAATVSGPEEVKRFEEAACRADRRIAVHLKIDTGMGRLGVWHEQATTVYEQIRASEHLQLAGVYTHFASPDEDESFTTVQRQRFLAALDRFPGLEPAKLFVHADNSAGIETLPGASPFNAVRIGLLQFGIIPRPHALFTERQAEPVFSFRTRIGLVKQLPAGTSISYGRTHTLERDATIAILCAGYADGIPRALSNRGKVLIRGQVCPILGRVTMDLTIVDVSAVGGVAVGDEAVLVGRQGDSAISITEFSHWADTIPWETLCSVSKRVPRLYRTSLGI